MDEDTESQNSINLNLVNLVGMQNKHGNSCLHTLFQSETLLPETEIVLRALRTCNMPASAFRVNNRVWNAKNYFMTSHIYALVFVFVERNPCAHSLKVHVQRHAGGTG